jgi:hypothetical protein
MTSRENKQKIHKSKLTIDGFFIPTGASQWETLAKKLPYPTVNRIPWEEMGSGSEVNERQFVTFRAIWDVLRDPKKIGIHKSRFGLAGTWAKAKEAIDADHEFHNYLGLLKSRRLMDDVKKDEEIWPGSFKPVKTIQEQVLKVDGLFDWERGRVRNQPATVDLEETLPPAEDDNHKHRPCAITAKYIGPY